MEDRAVPVDLVQENHSRLAISPRTVNDLAEYFAGVQTFDLNYLAVEIRRVGQGSQRVARAVFHSLHKLVRSTDRDVEVVDFTLNLLAIDELENIRVVNIQHSHVRTVALATLCHESRDRRQVS